MRKLGFVAIVLMLVFAVWAIGTTAMAQVDSNDNNLALMDDCDPANFPIAGGCALKPHQGDVSLTDFSTLLFSPLSVTVIGHPSWRNEPSYLSIRAGQTVRVTNKGGRDHTFTEVAEFGGGFVPPLNGVGVVGKVPLTPAPECVPPPGSLILEPGDTAPLNGLAPGLHRYQCCIHPWMRATVKVN